MEEANISPFDDELRFLPGDLYSVKIMWPRTVEERLRDRNTGFVCFMNRTDAEDAMEACSEADPFNAGRRLMMRWGKNVRKIAGGAPVVKKGTGGITDVVPLTTVHHKKSDLENYRAAAALEGALNFDSKSSIRVIPPSNKHRALFISTVASYVAKDGQQFEQLLLQREIQNPAFAFLTLPPRVADATQKSEHIFFKWRVYSFCQGDSFHTWNSEPFKMFEQHGCTWIPPPLDAEASRREEEEVKRKQEDLERQKQQRRFRSSKRSFLTGRQMEQGRQGGLEGGAKLNVEELHDFDRLFRQELCGSRDSICQAMAFCYEKSAAAKHISDLLRGLFMPISPETSVDTLIARLFLISDVVFNSQQPGVRNAFLYRSAIESMSPDAFKSMGNFARNNFRFTGRKRIISAITAVLGAWANWGVYDPVFLDELQARFEGKENTVSSINTKAMDETTGEIEDQIVVSSAADPDIDASIALKPKGEWTTIVEYPQDADDKNNIEGAGTNAAAPQNLDGKPLAQTGGGDTVSNQHTRLESFAETGNSATDEDADGEPLDEDADGESLEGSDCLEPLNNDADGEQLDCEDDGVDADDDADGEPLDEDAGEESVTGDPDGEPLDEIALS